MLKNSSPPWWPSTPSIRTWCPVAPARPRSPSSSRGGFGTRAWTCNPTRPRPGGSAWSAWRADAGIVTGRTALRVCVAHKGFMWLEIETRGRAAHGSRPAEGVDAIVKMGPVLAALGEHAESLAERVHPLVGAPSLHASLIEGGQELFIYPARCVLAVERRMIPGEHEANVVAEFEALVERCRTADPSLEIELRPGLAREPFAVPHDSDVVTALQRCLEGTGRDAAVYGHPP